MAARQIPCGRQGLRPGTVGRSRRAIQGLSRGTAAKRNISRRYGLVRHHFRIDRPRAGRMISAAHIPVLGREAIDTLAPHERGLYVDATFGGGGYSRAILDVP